MSPSLKVLTFVAAAFVSSCGDKPSSPAKPGQIVLAVQYERPAAPKVAGTLAMTRMKATVSEAASSKVVVERDLERVGSRWQGTIEVDAGDYKVTLDGFKGSLVKWHGEIAVSVGAGVTKTATIMMASTNGVPIAIAGADQTINLGDIIRLSGAASSDPDGEALTYRWTAPTGVTPTRRSFRLLPPVHTDLCCGSVMVSTAARRLRCSSLLFNQTGHRSRMPARTSRLLQARPSFWTAREVPTPIMMS